MMCRANLSCRSTDFLLIFLLSLWLFSGCSQSSPTGNEPAPDPGGGTETPSSESLDPGIDDDYSDIADISNFLKWGSYNVHDPSLIKDGDWYYMYSTDVFYGGGGVPADDPRRQPKIPIRKSQDLVHWHPVTHVFEQMPDDVVRFIRGQQPSYRPESIWAPFIMKKGDEFRLYYSAPANDGLKTAYLGMAVSTDPMGPWENKGLVLPTYPDSPYNGIDPAVVEDRSNGRSWLIFGSWSDGIHAVELDPQTGFRMDENDTGTIIAARKPYSDGAMGIEGAEVLYHPGFDKYYLFVSYGPLIDRYNVRVGRADQPQGPYYDFFGNDMAEQTDNFPRITAQYRFDNHSGWQGVGHTGLLRDGDSYYLASQGRLGRDIYLMDLHLRKMVWTEDGWPVVSPERYAAIPQEEITSDSIAGVWEHITLDKIGEKNSSETLTLSAAGTIQEYADGSWSLTGTRLDLKLSANRQFRVKVMRGWDWENDRVCLLFTGLNDQGISEWGKRKGD